MPNTPRMAGVGGRRNMLSPGCGRNLPERTELRAVATRDSIDRTSNVSNVPWLLAG